MPNTEPELAVNKDDKGDQKSMKAPRDTKAKNARLRLLKERHENYLVEQRGEDADMEQTEELRVPGAD